MSSPLLKSVLEAIPSHRDRALKPEEIAQRVAAAAAVPPEQAQAASAVALDLLRLLDLLQESEGHLHLGGQMQTYCRNSLLWYLANGHRLLANWARPGTAQDTVLVANLLERAPYVLKALEERRRSLATQAHQPLFATREQPCSVLLFKALHEGRIYLLHQWDQQAERYQLIGGKRRAEETPEQTAVREALEELPQAALVAGRTLFVKAAPIEPFEDWNVSPTYGALTRYDLHIFQAQVKGTGLTLSESDLWISLDEAVAGRTHRGAAIAPMAGQIAARDGDFLESLPPSVAQADPHRLSLPPAPVPAAAELPQLFISHRHKDHVLAAALVDVLRSAFVVRPADIRCTSVPPYRLPAGERTPDRLRRELAGARAVLGIITPDTADSSYVMFELGGAWAQGVATCPLLAHGATVADLPDPIGDLNPLRLDDEADCQQLLDDLQRTTTLVRQSGVGADVAARIRNLRKEAAAAGA